MGGGTDLSQLNGSQERHRNCKALNEVSQDRYTIERRIWIAKKKKRKV